MSLQKATVKHWVALQELLTAADLPTADLTETHLAHFWVMMEKDAVRGAIGMERYEEVGLLRSLVVHPDGRGRGYGTQLARHLETYAQTQGIRTLYLLTTTAALFFARHGYQDVARERVPAAIQQTAEFSTLCPDTARVMCKQLEHH